MNNSLYISGNAELLSLKIGGLPNKESMEGLRLYNKRKGIQMKPKKTPTVTPSIIYRLAKYRTTRKQVAMWISGRISEYHNLCEDFFPPIVALPFRHHCQ